MKFTVRDSPPRTVWALEQAGIHPLLSRLYAARGVQDPAELDEGLNLLLPPATLKGAHEAAALLADALVVQPRLCVVADYDCDGATACAVALRGLRLLGFERLDYLVPDRVTDGYGLTPTLARRVHAKGADWLITVDNGIASGEGVDAAKALGLKVLVTDHHLPGPELPAAEAIVNPNQPGCGFASKSLAGVGVMFYLLLALRAELRQRGRYAAAPQPKLDALLPLVALGTVADVVKLDANNRRLVAQGLRRIRAGQGGAGIAALLAASGREAARASSFDLGFALGPRINAAGRLADMTLGIECLLTDDPTRAADLARQLDGINRERRELEGGMREHALALVGDRLARAEAAPPAALTVFDPEFHEGVVGIVAARLKDRHHRPCFVFAASQAPGHEHELKGSGRSIAGFHLRDALDLVAKREPGLLLRFGGHAMAAGCTIAREGLPVFEEALARVAAEWLDDATLARRLETDGPLEPAWRRADMADTLTQAIWGQGFAPPTFSGEFDIISQRLVGEKHLSLKLREGADIVDGIWFGRADPLPARARLAYRLGVNEWQGQRRVQLVVEGHDEG